MGKKGIIPFNQAGFRKGRCTTDHLVKLTSHIKKKQFSRRKSTLATFFYVKKAYDSVWHARLLYKLKNIGITGMMFQYFKNLLSEICICTRVGKTYSSNKTIDMGIPQGSSHLLHLSYLTLLYMISQKYYQITHMWRNMQMILLFGLTQL